jgi:hypothetical protein
MAVAPQRLIAEHEPLAPWLAASLLTLVAFVAGVVVGNSASATHKAVLAVCFCAVVTATELVLHRVHRSENVALLALRARPAIDELTTGAAADARATNSHTSNLPPYAAGMLRYSDAVVELLEHAVDVALQTDADTTELASGRDDAAALRNLLQSMAAEPVHLQQAAKVHTICSLWESNQARLEHLAADLDADFHRHWRTRHIATLRLRHGEAPQREDVAMPYRDTTPEE